MRRRNDIKPLELNLRIVIKKLKMPVKIMKRLFLLKGELMKRFLTLAVIALFVILPAESFSRSAISDKDLDDITAEEGVSINLINVSVGGTSTLTSISWGDTSGFTPGYTTPGYFGFRNISITGYLANVTSGTMNVDIGTSPTPETKIIIVSTPLTFGTANVTGWLMADRIPTLDSTGFAQGGVMSVNGFSTVISGTVMIYAHD